MTYTGFPRGRNKALSTTRLQLLNGGATANANLSVNSAAPSVVTFQVGTWTVLQASTSQVVNNIEVFDSFGYTARIGVGGVGSEVDFFLDLPGGNGWIPVLIPAGSRITVQPLYNPVFDSTVVAKDQPELTINWYD